MVLLVLPQTLWLAGKTTTEIAQIAHLDRTVVVKIIKTVQPSRLKALHITEHPPIYNVWSCANCAPRFGQKHPGQIPGQAVVNLLLWLTKPFDVVVDPMAGGGTIMAALWNKENKKELELSDRNDKGQFKPSVLQGSEGKSHPTRDKATETFKVSKKKVVKAIYVESHNPEHQRAVG